MSSVFLELPRHRIAQSSRLLGQPRDLRRSSRRTALLTTDIADGFEVREQLVEEGEIPSASDVRERVVEFAKGLLRLDGTQCKNEAERENAEPDQPHGHLL